MTRVVASASSDVDELVLLGPWFAPRRTEGIVPSALALSLKLTEDHAAAALERLRAAREVTVVCDAHRNEPRYAPSTSLFKRREAILRAKERRHRCLLRARSYDLPSLIIALVMSQEIEDGRTSSSFGDGGWRTMLELEVYLPEFAPTEIHVACDSLVAEGLLERLPDGHVELTGRGRLRFDSPTKELLGLGDGESVLDAPAERAVFISYDTRESKLAEWIKRVLRARLPERVKVFVANHDIAVGTDPIRVMLKEHLLRADALVALCSRRSHTSSWLWWESGAVWARGGLVVPLFVDIGAGDFKGPLTIVTQGRALTDPDQLHSAVEAVARVFQPAGGPIEKLTAEELRALQDALAACRSSDEDDEPDPVRRALRATKYVTRIFVQPMPERTVDDAFRLKLVGSDHVTLVKESNGDHINIPIPYIASFSPRSPHSDDQLLTLRFPAQLLFDGHTWRFRVG